MTLSWTARAACHGLDPRMFFPETDAEADPAKSVCGRCQVRDACLEHALGRRERDGVWGGHTELERRRLIRQRRHAS